jgi:hypothetical protein
MGYIYSTSEILHRLLYTVIFRLDPVARFHGPCARLLLYVPLSPVIFFILTLTLNPKLRLPLSGRRRWRRGNSTCSLLRLGSKFATQDVEFDSDGVNSDAQLRRDELVVRSFFQMAIDNEQEEMINSFCSPRLRHTVAIAISGDSDVFEVRRFEPIKGYEMRG